MRIKISDDKQVDIAFQHSRPDLAVSTKELRAIRAIKPNKVPLDLLPSTLCVLKIGEKEFKGVSFCSTVDQFRKRKGCTGSLARAFAAEGNLSKDERKKVYQTLFKFA